MFSNKSLKLLRANKTLIISGIMFGLITMSFSNCGQPGSVELQNKDQTSEDILGGGNPLPIPPPQPGQPQLVTKSTSVDVSNITTKKVDVLIVIDNSGSMNYEQKNMAQRFGSFIDQLQGLDWQLGITTTDMSSDTEKRDGRLLTFSTLSGDVRVLNSTMNIDLVKSAFAATIQRPQSEGSGYEQGIAATYRSIERAYSGTDNYSSFNRQLIRADAALSVIIVTDADETPPSGNFTSRNDPEKLLSYIKGLYPSKPVNFNSIIVKSGDSTCLNAPDGANGNEGYGIRYEMLSNATNGYIGSVCAADYASQLKIIGDSVASLVTQMTLDCIPVDANGDGVVDLDIRNPSGQLITSYTRTGAQIKFNQALPVGRTTALYYCVQ